MGNSFPSQIYFVPPNIVPVAFVIYTWLLLSELQKTKLAASSTFVPSKEANESQKSVRTAETRKLRCNATVKKWLA
jgi:hypothetical protein